jgi:nucleotide-binding universal stress UspA family protein
MQPTARSPWQPGHPSADVNRHQLLSTHARRPGHGRQTPGMTEASRSSPATDDAAHPVTGRIVVGADGSDGSMTALNWALREARLRGTTVHAVICWIYHPGWDYSGLGSMFPTGYSPAGGSALGGRAPNMAPAADTGLGSDTVQVTEADVAEAAVDNVLKAAITQALEQDAGSHQPSVTVTSQAVQGHAAKALLDAATGEDLLVVGSRGHGGFVGALLGSVSHHVVTQARCPVVIVPNPNQPARDVDG